MLVSFVWALLSGIIFSQVSMASHSTEIIPSQVVVEAGENKEGGSPEMPAKGGGTVAIPPFFRAVGGVRRACHKTRQVALRL